jgi:Xaa-Pro aminopeptidase
MLLSIIVMAPCANGQSANRDHLTAAESNIVRDTQELDQRIDVLIKAAERRFAIINGPSDPLLNTPATKPKKKYSEEDEAELNWGESPKGTRAELIDDVAGILDEAISNIDDVSRKDEKNALIGKSLHKLASATKGFLNQLVALRSQAKSEDEVQAMERAGDLAQQIIDASAKAPAPVEENNPKKKKP